VTPALLPLPATARPVTHLPATFARMRRRPSAEQRGLGRRRRCMRGYGGIRCWARLPPRVLLPFTFAHGGTAQELRGRAGGPRRRRHAAQRSASLASSCRSLSTCWALLLSRLRISLSSAFGTGSEAAALSTYAAPLPSTLALSACMLRPCGAGVWLRQRRAGRHFFTARTPQGMADFARGGHAATACDRWAPAGAALLKAGGQTLERRGRRSQSLLALLAFGARRRRLLAAILYLLR